MIREEEEEVEEKVEEGAAHLSSEHFSSLVLIDKVLKSNNLYVCLL